MSESAAISDVGLRQILTDRDAASMSNDKHQRRPPASNANRSLTPSKGQNMTPTSRATTVMNPWTKQSRCARCDIKVPELLCSACHEDDDGQAGIQDPTNQVPHLYSHLCKSAAIVSAILPRRKKESNERYIQRLLNEADNTEATGMKEMMEVGGGNREDGPQKSVKMAQAEARLDAAMVEDADEANFGRVFRDEFGRARRTDDDTSDHDEGGTEGRMDGLSHELRQILEGGSASRCPACDWKVEKDKCMRCGYSISNDLGLESSGDDDENPLEAMFDKLLDGR